MQGARALLTRGTEAMQEQWRDVVRALGTDAVRDAALMQETDAGTWLVAGDRLGS